MRYDSWKTLSLIVRLLCGLAASPGWAQTTPPAVLVRPAELRSLAKQIEFVGRIEAVDKVDLRARVTGLLGPRRFQDGDQVKSGQVLFEIERAPFEAAVEQREAELAGAKAALANAEQQLKRGKTLVKTKAVSESQVDQLTADDLRAEAAVKQAQAALDLAKINLSYTTIASPIDGRVGRATVTPGNLVGPDSGVLATVVRDDEVRVLFSVSQREMLEARKNGADQGEIKALLKLADSSFYKENGALDFLDVTVDPKTDGQTVRATFPNPDHLLTNGQTVRVVLEPTSEEKTVAIPEAAVAIDQSGPYVFVITSAGQVEQRPVTLSGGNDGLVGVEKGVKSGELVVVQGQQRIRPGMKVSTQRIDSVSN